MAYNLDEIRLRVRNRLDDDSFEQTYLDRAINYAQWQITNKNKLKFLETTTSLSVNPGDHTVALPTDFHEYQHLRVVSPVNVRMDLTNRYIDYADFVNTYIDATANPVSRPYNWSEYGGYIRFSQPSDSTYTLRLDYQKKAPTLVNGTDVPVIPEEFAELLELGAYMRIAKREDDYEVKLSEEQDYNSLLLDLKSVYGRKKGPGGLRRMRTA